MVKCLALSLLSLLALCRFRGTSAACASVEYTTQKDVDVAADASEKAKDWCEGGFKGEADPEKGHDSLMSTLGGENRVYNILKKAESQDDLSKKAEEEIHDIPWLIKKAFAIVASFIMIFIWLVCCWTCFCKRCRCCAKERSTHKVVKFIGILVLAGMGLGIFILAVMAFNGASKTLDGIENFSCTTAKLLNTTLSGSQDPKFIGTSGLLKIFEDLDKAMAPNSGFMTQVDQTLQETLEIDAAVTEATETLKLMKDTIGLSQNMHPKTGSSDAVHNCELCSQLQAPLAEVITTLESSFAKSLNDARGEVRSQLEGGTRADLQCDMRATAEPLQDLVGSIRDSLSWFIDDDGFGQARTVIENRAFLILPGVAAIILGLAMFACTCSSYLCFTFREKAKVVKEGTNPYNSCVYRTAVVAWCWGFCYCILFFLFGGILIAISVPFAGMCLVMEDISSTQFTNIYPALGMGGSGMEPGTDNWDIAMGLVDQCFSPTFADGSGNFMDIMFIRENGTKKTMRTILLSDVVSVIDDKFKQLNMTNNVTSLAQQPSVTKLTNILSAPVSSFIVPASSLSSNSDYMALANDDRGTAGLAIGFATSLNCQDYTVPNNMDPLTSGQQISGMQTWSSRLSRYGNKFGSACTPSSFVCSAASVSDQAICSAATNFLNLQKGLKSTTNRVFRCDLFKKPNGLSVGSCDPADMVQNPDGSWSGSCAKTVCTAGSCVTTFERKAISCNLDEFTLYVQKYADRITKTFTRVDTTVPLVETKIKTGLKSWVDTYFLNPIRDLVEQAGCGFLNVLWKEMVSGLCYQGAYGIKAIGTSYVGMAGLCVIMTILAYMVWRRQIDNSNEKSPAKVVAIM